MAMPSRLLRQLSASNMVDVPNAFSKLCRAIDIRKNFKQPIKTYDEVNTVVFLLRGCQDAQDESHAQIVKILESMINWGFGVKRAQGFYVPLHDEVWSYSNVSCYVFHFTPPIYGTGGDDALGDFIDLYGRHPDLSVLRLKDRNEFFAVTDQERACAFFARIAFSSPGHVEHSVF